MTDHDVSPIESARLAGLLGSLPIDDLVASVLEATAGGMDFGALLRRSPAAFLVDAPDAPVERLETALTDMRSGLAGPSTPEVAAGLLACVAGLAGRGRLGEVAVPGDLEGAFLELSELAPPWRDFFATAAERATGTPTLGRSEQRVGARRPGLSRVGRYEILGLLGRGANGVVYRARQAGTRREVALKVLRSDVLTPEVLARFEREAILLGRLEHPAIAQVFESGMADVHGDLVPFIALELVEGRSLLQHASLEQLSDSKRIELMRQVALAVQHAHEKDIVHRDLSPTNVLVTADGQPKVIDFGIARILDPDLRTSVLHTLAGAIVGTPAYMSPEQAGGKADLVDRRTDVWSLGVLLFELLTGELPLPVAGCSVTDALRTIVDVEPARLRVLRPDLGADADAVLGKALAVEREQRYQTVRSFAEDLGRLLAGAPVSARAPTALDRTRRFVRRNRAMVAATASVVVLLVVGLVVSITGWTRATRAEARSQQQLEALARVFEVPLAMADVLERSLAPTEKGSEMLARIEAALPVLRELPEGSRYSRLAATFHEQMGDACMRRGARAGAEQHFGRAVELWLDSSAGAPGDIEPLRRLATTTAKLGDARRERGFLGDAEQLYRTALRIDEELAALHPGNDDILDDLAWSYLRMAGLLSQREEHAGSCELYARALYSMRQAFDRKPEDEDRLFGMGCMHFDMANALHRLSGPADEIEPLYETAMQFATRLAREHADNPDYAGFCTGCLATTGRWFHGRGDLDRAATALDAAIRAARLWIDHAERQGDRGGGVHVQNMRSLVLSAFEELAALELRRGGVAEAKAALGEARSCLEDPAAAGREQAPHEVVMVSLAGDIAMARGEAAAAERLWREAILVSGDNTERGRLLARLAGHGMATTEERGELDRRMHDLERARTPTEGQMLLGLQELLGDSDGMAATRRRLEEAARPVVHRMREILAGSR